MDILSGLISMFAELIGQALLILLVAVTPIVLICVTVFTVRYIKGERVPKRIKPPTYQRRSVLLRLFWDLPNRIVSDIYTQNPDRYKDTGIIIFEGEQGSGKTIAAVEYIFTQMQKYPCAQFNANIDVKGQTELLDGLEKIINSDNGIYGQINLVDEIQNWLNSNESKNVPVEFIGEICQQRKQAKQIIGTTQRFNRMSKQLRQECSLLCKPITILGCLTIVRVYKPNVDADGVVKKAHRLRTYFFVHTDELREAYDTYAKVKRLNLKGFKPKAEQINNDNDVQIVKQSE